MKTGIETIIERADALKKGDRLADGSKVTGPWRMYARGDGYGSVEIDGYRVKYFCAEAMEVVKA